MCRIFFTDAEEEAAVALWNRRAALAAAEAPNDGMVLAREYEALIRALCESNNPVSVLADWTAHAGLPAPRAAAEAEEGWRPIDEAPKTGEPFLAYFPDDQSVEMVHWSSAGDPKFSTADGWYVYRSESGWPIIGEFSHFRLLPPPPAGSEPR